MPKIIKTKKSIKNKLSSKFVYYLLSSLKGSFITIIMFFIVAFILYKNNDFNILICIFTYFSIIIGAFISGYSSYKTLKGKGFLCGIIGGIIYSVIIIASVLAIMHFNFTYRILFIIPISLITGSIGGIVGANY